MDTLLGTLDDIPRAFSHWIPNKDASWFFAYGCWFGLIGDPFLPLLNRSLSFALHLLFLCHSGNQFCKPLKIDCPSLYHWSLGWENITSSFSSCAPGVKREPLSFLKYLSCRCFSASYFVKILHTFLKTPKGLHSKGVYFDAALPFGLFLFFVGFFFFLKKRSFCILHI